jgi:hypothetical protein
MPELSGSRKSHGWEKASVRTVDAVHTLGCGGLTSRESNAAAGVSDIL